MIVIQNEEAEEHAFLELLTTARGLVCAEVFPNNILVRVLNDDEFEELVFLKMKMAASGTDFENQIVRTGLNAFPDIVAKNYFGVEVKMTKSDKWQSFGNSILESTREEVKKIYVFFGKFGGEQFDIRFKPYSDSISDIKVTHYPRYMVDMELDPGENIFEKMGVEYDTVRSSPIKYLKEYYRKNLSEGEELWWLDNSAETDPILRLFSTLDEEQKNGFKAEALILFPELFGRSTKKSNRAALYLTSKYKVVSHNFRDIFSASGQVEIVLGGRTIKVPRIVALMKELFPIIQEKINLIEEDNLKYYWSVEGISDLRIQQWKELVNNQGSLTDGQTITSLLD